MQHFRPNDALSNMLLEWKIYKIIYNIPLNISIHKYPYVSSEMPTNHGKEVFCFL